MAVLFTIDQSRNAICAVGVGVATLFVILGGHDGTQLLEQRLRHD